MFDDLDIIKAFNHLEGAQLEAVFGVAKILSTSHLLFDLLIDNDVEPEKATSFLAFLLNNANLNILKEADLIKTEEDYLEIVSKISSLVGKPEDPQPVASSSGE